MAQGYTPFVGPCFQNKIKGKGENIKGTKAANKQTEENRKVLTLSLLP